MNEQSWAGSPPQVVDSTGNGHDGTAIGGADTVPDATFGRVGSFSGSGQYVSLGGSSSTVPVERSYVVWINVAQNSSLFGLPILTNGSPGSGDFFGVGGTEGEGAGVPQYALYVDHWGCCTSWTSNAVITPDLWQQVAMTFDGVTMQFFVNGSPVATQNSGASALYAFDINSLVIGGNTIGGTTTTGSFIGNIRGARVYDAVLNPQQILAIYNSDINTISEPSTLSLLLAQGILLMLRRRFA